VKSKLSEVNPYLRDPVKRERAVLKSVASSSAIEGIRVSLKTRLNGPGRPASSKARVKP
jgi:Fic family protein